MSLLKRFETVIENELGLSPDCWRVEGHGAPANVFFLEVSDVGAGNMKDLIAIASEVKDLLSASLGADYLTLTAFAPELVKSGFSVVEGPSAAVLTFASSAAAVQMIRGIEYGANPDKLCILLGYENPVYFVTDEDAPLKVPESAEKAFVALGRGEDWDCEIPEPAFDRYDWLTPDGKRIKAAIEALGFSVRFGMTNTEAADIPCFC